MLVAVDAGVRRVELVKYFERGDMMKYFVVPTVICGVKLFAVEESDGYVLKYCETKERAEAFMIIIMILKKIK